MALLIMGASFMTVCSASESGNIQVHIFTETCENHDCSHSNDSQSYTNENCQHQICLAQSITSDFLPSHTNQFVVAIPPAKEITGIFFSSEFQIISLFSLPDPSLISAQRAEILRI